MLPDSQALLPPHPAQGSAAMALDEEISQRSFALRDTPRRRPADLVDAADERPPHGALALLGVQHAGTAMAFIT